MCLQFVFLLVVSGWPRGRGCACWMQKLGLSL